MELKRLSIKILCFLVGFTALIILTFTQCTDSNNQKVKSKSNAVSTDNLKRLVYDWAWGENAQHGVEPPDSAIIYIDEFQHISAKKKEYKDLCTALKARYYYYRSRNNVAEAYRSVLEQINAARQTKEDIWVYDALYLAGILLYMNGNYAEGLDYFLQIADMNPLESNYRCMLFYALASNLIHNGDNEQAAQYFKLAEAETRKPDFSNLAMKGQVFFGHGNMYLDISDHKLFDFTTLKQSRVDSLKTGLEMLLEASRYFDDYVNYSLIALTHALLDNFEKTKAPETKAIELGAKSPAGISTVYYVRAIIRYREKSYREAIELATQGLEVSLSNHNYSDAEMNLNVLYHACHMIGDDNQAFQYLEDKIAIKDSLIIKERQKQFIVNQIRLDSQIKEAQINMEQLHNKILQRTLIFSVTGGILIIIFLGGWIRYGRIINRKNRELYLQIKEQDRLTEDVKQMTIQYEQLVQSASQAAKENVDRNTTNDKFPGDMQQRQLISRLHKYLLQDKNFAKAELDYKEIVSALATNKTYLFEAVKIVAGKTLNEYINALRLNEAKQMLDNNPEFTIDTIAGECGFNVPRTFYRLFREHYQLSPTEYRKMSENKE
jgi:AraC-like DNA-binding protein